MAPEHDTGLELLTGAVGLLDLAAGACDSDEDAERFEQLAGRIRSYLAVSRPTTTLGMPRIPEDATRLSAEAVVHRTAAAGRSHIRVLPNLEDTAGG
jgi:hypothetical protein